MFYLQAGREVQWIIYKTCQCALPHDFAVQESHFTCTAHDYVIFRLKLSGAFDSSDATDLPSLEANLSNFFAREDKTQITIFFNGGTYFIEPGPCGLTVPQLNSPHCLDSAPTQAAASSPLQDTTVTTVVAIMSAAMVLVVLGGCIVFLVVGLWKMQVQTACTALSKDIMQLMVT